MGGSEINQTGLYRLIKSTESSNINNVVRGWGLSLVSSVMINSEVQRNQVIVGLGYYYNLI